MKHSETSQEIKVSAWKSANDSPISHNKPHGVQATRVYIWVHPVVTATDFERPNDCECGQWRGGSLQHGLSDGGGRMGLRTGRNSIVMSLATKTGPYIYIYMTIIMTCVQDLSGGAYVALWFQNISLHFIFFHPYNVCKAWGN